MIRIAIINGPNLNLLGMRESDIYGTTSFQTYLETLHDTYPNIDITYYQSNHEGALIDYIHRCDGYAGIVLNAGAYTHTSIAIADAVRAVPVPVIEVHISNPHARERYRHHSYLTPVCMGVISGFGLQSYDLAIKALLNK